MRLGIRRTGMALAVAALAFPAAASAGRTSVVTAHRVTGTGHGGAAQPAFRTADPTGYRQAKTRLAAQVARQAPGAPGAAVNPFVSSIVLNKPGLSSLDPTSQLDPSDSTGGVSPTNYMEFVNATIARFDKTALNQLQKIGLTAFVGGTAACDPQIQWDNAAQRWLYAAIRCDLAPNAGQLYFGWSKTATPTFASSSWCRFILNSGSVVTDYPKLGHDDAHAIIGTNEFSGNGAVYAGSKIRAFNVPSGTTCPASVSLVQFTTTTTGSSGFTPVPANTFSSSAVGFVTSTPANSGSRLNLFKVTGTPPANPSISSAGNVTVPAFSLPPSVPQKGTQNQIDSSDTRETQAVATADPGAGGAMALWTQHTVNDGANHAMVRWYEVLPATATLRQSGKIDPSGTLFAFNGAISPTTSGDSAVIHYNTSSSTTFVDVRAQSRVAATPLGTMAGQVTLATSPTFDRSFTCSPCRWGDYAGAAPDPSSSTLVWGTSMLLMSGGSTTLNWTTRNFALTP